MEDPVTDCGFLPFHSPDAGDEEIAQVTEPIKAGVTDDRAKGEAGGSSSVVRSRRSEVRATELQRLSRQQAEDKGEQ
jgi:hypothetical protein